jgi:hypothetical protein
LNKSCEKLRFSLFFNGSCLITEVIKQLYYRHLVETARQNGSRRKKPPGQDGGGAYFKREWMLAFVWKGWYAVLEFTLRETVPMSACYRSKNEKIYQVEFHLDEMNRSTRNRKFRPFVCDLDKQFEDYCSILKEGVWIRNWDNGVTLVSCQDGDLLDRLSNDSDMYLLSDNVISVFERNNIKGFQFLPVTILMEDGNRLQNYNYVGNVYKTVSCLNLTESVYSTFGDKNSKYPHPNPAYWGRIRTFERRGIVINQDMIPDDLDIFRLDEHKLRVLVSERFVNVWRSHKFSNLEFSKLTTV